MKLKVSHKYKSIFSAEFNVISNDEIFGNIKIEGKSGTKESKCLINYKGTHVILDNIPDARLNGRKRTRIYRVTFNHEVVGHIYQSRRSLFSKENIVQLSLPGSLAHNYVILKYGKLINMIYQDSIQIAEYECDQTVIDMLYNYDLYAIDEESALRALIMLTYGYMINGFDPGIEVANSYNKSEFENKKKDLLKYNPDFKNQVNK